MNKADIKKLLVMLIILWIIILGGVVMNGVKTSIWNSNSDVIILDILDTKKGKNNG